MRKDSPAMVFLDVPAIRGKMPALELRRTPMFLRFVMTGTDWQTLDALDQLDDAPKPEERVLAAVKDGEDGCLHLDSRDNRGRRVGQWFKTATYRLIAPQPEQSVLRDAARWQAWVLQQVAAAKGLTL
jgi:hypothetical protein